MGKGEANIPLNYIWAKILAHRIFFRNKWCLGNPKNLQNLICLGPPSLFRQYIRAGINQVVPAFQKKKDVDEI
jgi:hypothetical protein